MSGASFNNQYSDNPSKLINAIFTDALISGANLSGLAYPSRGFTASQLYSTANYKNGDLAGLDLSNNDLKDWNLSEQNLSKANLSNSHLEGANLCGANLTNADLRWDSDWPFDETDLSGADLRGAATHDEREWFDRWAQDTNMIFRDGSVRSVHLDDGNTLVVRDYDGDPAGLFGPVSPMGINIQNVIVMDATGTLRIELENDAWDSLISFQPGYSVTLNGGKLDLTFAADANPLNQLGRTIRLFDWTGVSPVGQFNVVSQYSWDLRNLYSTGEVTLVPEPTAVVLASLGWLILRNSNKTLLIGSSR